MSFSLRIWCHSVLDDREADWVSVSSSHFALNDHFTKAGKSALWFTTVSFS